MNTYSRALSFVPRSGFSNTTSPGLVLLSPTSETTADVAIPTKINAVTTFSTITLSSSSSLLPVSVTEQAGPSIDAGIATSRSSTPAPSVPHSSKNSIFTSASPSHTSTASPDAGRPDSAKLSPSTAIGIGVGIGLLGLILLTALSLFFFQKWRDRSTGGPLHHRRARLWKGFTPAPHVYTDYAKGIDEGYSKGLLEPPTPSPALSSPFPERHARWSWQAPYMDSPLLTPMGSNAAVELPARTSRALIA